MGGNFCLGVTLEGRRIVRAVYACGVESYGVYEQLIAVRLWLRRSEIWGAVLEGSGVSEYRFLYYALHSCVCVGIDLCVALSVAECVLSDRK